MEGQPGLHSVSLSKIKIRSIKSYLIDLVPEEEARAQPSWHNFSCSVRGSKPKAVRHFLSYLPILIILSVPSCSGKNTVLYRSTFTLYEMYWLPWFRVSHRKSNHILLSEVLHAFLGILAAYTSVRPKHLTRLSGVCVYLVMVNGNWCQGLIIQHLQGKIKLICMTVSVEDPDPVREVKFIDLSLALDIVKLNESSLISTGK